MSAFLSELLLRDNNDGTMTLIGPLAYRSDLLEIDLVVPGGFVTDFASVPRGLWNLLPKVGNSDRAAVVHDYLYAHGGVTRGQADGVFKEALIVCGVSGWRLEAFYLGVRSLGWVPWRNNRKADHVEADH